MKKIFLILTLTILIIVPTFFVFGQSRTMESKYADDREKKVVVFELYEEIGWIDEAGFIHVPILTEAVLRKFTFNDNINDLYGIRERDSNFKKVKKDYISRLTMYESPSYIVGK